MCLLLLLRITHSCYQIAFDLVDKENQVYTQAVIAHIESSDLKADHSERQERLLSVLNGTVKDTLTRQFMKKNNSENGKT